MSADTLLRRVEELLYESNHHNDNSFTLDKAIELLEQVIDNETGLEENEIDSVAPRGLFADVDDETTTLSCESDLLANTASLHATIEISEKIAPVCANVSPCRTLPNSISNDATPLSLSSSSSSSWFQALENIIDFVDGAINGSSESDDEDLPESDNDNVYANYLVDEAGKVQVEQHLNNRNSNDECKTEKKKSYRQWRRSKDRETAGARSGFSSSEKQAQREKDTGNRRHHRRGCNRGAAHTSSSTTTTKRGCGRGCAQSRKYQFIFGPQTHF